MFHATERRDKMSALSEIARAASTANVPQSADSEMRGVVSSSAMSLPLNFDKLFASVWDNSRDGFRITDAGGIIVSVNQSFCALIGMSESQLIGKPFTVIYDSKIDRSRMERAYAARFAAKTERFRERKSIPLKTSRQIDVEIDSYFISSGDGTPYIFSSFRDRTDQRRAEEALQQSEERYRSMFANAVQPMFQSSVEGKFLNANRALLKLLGYSSFEELQALDLRKDVYLNGEERGAVIHLLQMQGAVANLEIELKKKNGKQVTVLEHARALKNAQGDIVGYEGFLEDITLKKKLQEKAALYMKELEHSRERLTELNAQKDKFISILSHDLRSPLGSMLGLCNLLLEEKDNLSEFDRTQYISYIKESASNLMNLVIKLLEWSRLESGRIRLDMETLKVSDLAGASARALAGTARGKEITVRLEVPETHVVRGDEHLLKEVFHNLVGNALKFTPRGGRITVSSTQTDDGAVVVRVADTGIGIPEKDLARLFRIEDKYSRTGTEGEEGSGLGLTLVKEIVQKHNGAITAESTPGEGTTFILTFPPAKKRSGGSVLIVDNEEGMRVLLAHYVKRARPEAIVFTAADGSEALRQMEETAPDCILTDYDMPGVNGVEFIRAVRERAETRDVPVLVITGIDSDSNEEELLNAGATRVFSKPVSFDRLSSALNEFAQSS